MIRAALFVLLVGCKTPQPPATHAIAIRGMQFVPATLSAKVGDTIVWTNEDIVPHTATAPSGAFDSKSLETGAVFRFRPTAPAASPSNGAGVWGRIATSSDPRL